MCVSHCRHYTYRSALLKMGQSLRGDRYVETMLSLIETCRQQKRNVFQYLVRTLTTRKPGSLLPKTPSNSLPTAA